MRRYARRRRPARRSRRRSLRRRPIRRKSFRRRLGRVGDYITFRARVITTIDIPSSSGVGIASKVTLNSFGDTFKNLAGTYQEYKIGKVFVKVTPRYQRPQLGFNQGTIGTDTVVEGAQNDVYYFGFTPLNVGNSDITEDFMTNLKGVRIRHFSQGGSIQFKPAWQALYLATGTTQQTRPSRGWLSTANPDVEHGVFCTYVPPGMKSASHAFADVIYTAYCHLRYRK